MTTILFTFIIALALSLTLTPIAGRLGKYYGAVDTPSKRNVHTHTMPRSGGLAITVSFFVALFASTILATDVSNLLSWNQQRAFGLLGGVVIFSVGFFDDFRRLEPWVKFLFQIAAASLAFYGGIRIETFALDWTVVNFGILSWAITVFWFLLFMNAVNLIDGLDGLAAGVALFTSTVMVILTVIQPNYLAALEFAALAGALLGFLRYNFNPASVFMGDGGSYFIGYTIAALAILGSTKTQVGATLLIPLLALGVPIFDTILSPVRRFIRGQKMFQPDNEHIHHRLVAMGLSSRRAVLIIYGASFALCAIAILLVNLRNEMAGLLLVILGAGAFLVVRKLGYLEYLAADKLFGWFRDLSDEAGFTRTRRSFLSLQIEIEHARNMEELWDNTCRALEMLRFDRAELHIYKSGIPSSAPIIEKQPPPLAANDCNGEEEKRRTTTACDEKQAVWETTEEKGGEIRRIWARGHHRRGEDGTGNGLLRVEIPLSALNPIAARLTLIKDLLQEPIQPYTLRRIEYLRRSMTTALQKIKK